MPVALDTAPSPRGLPGWLLGVVAAATAVAVGLCAWMWWTVPSDDSVEASTRAAQNAAERAIVPILSYDAARLDEDEQAAASYMTTAYGKQYAQLFEVIKQNAPSTQTVVKAELLQSGIVRSGEERVEVLLFVDMATTNKQSTEPIVYKNQVRVQMEKVGGEWLVDCLLTAPNGVCD